MADKIDFGNDDFDAAIAGIGGGGGGNGGEHEPPGLSADYSTAHNGWQPPPGLDALGKAWPPPICSATDPDAAGWQPPPGATGDVSALGGAPSGVLGTLRGVWPPDGVSLLGANPKGAMEPMGNNTVHNIGEFEVAGGKPGLGGVGDPYLLFIQHGPAGEAGAGISDAIDTSVAADHATLLPTAELPETQLLPGAVYPPW